MIYVLATTEEYKKYGAYTSHDETEVVFRKSNLSRMITVVATHYHVIGEAGFREAVRLDRGVGWVVVDSLAPIAGRVE
jgi:hypothetical protein